MKRNKILEELLETNPDMDREQLEKIVTILMKNNPEIKIDKNILGGGIIRIGDKIIDGSIRRELDNWKRN